MKQLYYTINPFKIQQQTNGTGQNLSCFFMLSHAIMSIPEGEKQLEGNNAYVLQNSCTQKR